MIFIFSYKLRKIRKTYVKILTFSKKIIYFVFNQLFFYLKSKEFSVILKMEVEKSNSTSLCCVANYLTLGFLSSRGETLYVVSLGTNSSQWDRSKAISM